MWRGNFGYFDCNYLILMRTAQGHVLGGAMFLRVVRAAGAKGVKNDVRVSRSLRSASCCVPPCQMMPVLIEETLWTTQSAPKRTLRKPPKSSSVGLSVEAS